VFPLVKHTHRTSGFFKIRGVNLNHSEFEDFMFRNREIGDFIAELVSENDLDTLVVSIEVRREVNPAVAGETMRIAVREKFGVTPRVVVLETGALARKFEGSVKMPGSSIGGSGLRQARQCSVWCYARDGADELSGFTQESEAPDP
jgi:phenylacetate-CoA ligase